MIGAPRPPGFHCNRDFRFAFPEQADPILVDGDLRVAPQKQGEEGFDDYVLSAGLVLTGSRRLGTVKLTLNGQAPPPIRR